MNRCLTILVFLLVACTSVPQPYEPFPLPESKIVGTVAVALANYQPHCTGTAIAPKIVITAAHCLLNHMPFTSYFFKSEPKDILVMSGYRDITHAPPEAFSRVEKIHLHPGFPNYEQDHNHDGMGRWDDIAVLILKDPVQVKWVPILPMELVDKVLTKGTLVHIAGYGLYGILYEAVTPYQYRTDHEIWIGGIGFPDHCLGDSGGPTMVKVDGSLYLIGATSRGGVWQKTPCGEGGINTLVSAYEGWLLAKTGKEPEVTVGPPNRAIGYLLGGMGFLLLGWAATRKMTRRLYH